MELNWKKFTELLLKIMTESSEDCYPFESCNYKYGMILKKIMVVKL